MNNDERKVCKRLDWTIHEYETDVELEKYSPAGEDFIFTASRRGFTQSVTEYAADFDPDEHAEMWVNNMHNVRGVPQSIRVLIDDADAIDEMLNELAISLNKIRRRRK